VTKIAHAVEGGDAMRSSPRQPGPRIFTLVERPADGPRRREALRTELYPAAVGVAAVAAFLPLAMLLGLNRETWLTTLILTSGAVCSQVIDLSMVGQRSMRIAYVFTLAAALLLPPQLVLFVAAIQFVPRWLRRQERPKALARDVVIAVVTAMTAWGAGALRSTVSDEIGSGAAWATAGLAACLVFVLVDWTLRYGWRSLLRHEGAAGSDDLSLRDSAVDLAVITLGVALAVLIDTNPWLAPFAVAPLALVHRSLRVPLLEQQARVEPKTGLYNAAYFSEVAATELDRARRYDRPLALLVVDLDLLREVNNTFGHLTGDAVIAAVAEVFKGELRPLDVAARFGGEEFAVLLPETTREEALLVAERIRAGVAAQRVTAGATHEPVQATVSIGVAAFPDDGASPTALLHRADVAVYSAKLQGRNRVVAAGREDLEELLQARRPHADSTPRAPAPDPDARTEPIQERNRPGHSFSFRIFPLIVPAALGGVVVSGVMTSVWLTAIAFASGALLQVLLQRRTTFAAKERTVANEAAQERAEELLRSAESLHNRTISVERANRLLRQRSAAAMETLTAAIDARDQNTAGHSRRVRELALAIGRELDLSQAELEVLSNAALFHDIGKLAVPEAVLLKPEKLEDSEWQVVQRHPEEGVRIVERLGFLADALPAIRHHHEQYDGSGYPSGLRGDEIPLGARIVHVADALDAMLTSRVYREALTPYEAVEELRKGTGTQFCPRCIAALDRVLVADLLDGRDAEVTLLSA
jgi:diguanylate cyclase (GGDEF)-like protein/putative nucleotidyltransferase with HDIG domain